MAVDTNWMSENIFLHQLKEHEARIIQEHFKVHYYQSGDEIVAEGEESGALKILYSGCASISCRKDDGKPVFLNEAKEASAFGEITFLTGGRANATVTAHSSCIVYELSRQDYCGLLSKSQEMVISLLTYVLSQTADIIRQMNVKQHAALPDTPT